MSAAKRTLTYSCIIENFYKNFYFKDILTILFCVDNYNIGYIKSESQSLLSIRSLFTLAIKHFIHLRVVS